MESTKQKSELLELTGLWLKEDKNGNKIMTGKMNNLNILIMKNKYKEEDKHPDYKMFIGKPIKKEDK